MTEREPLWEDDFDDHLPPPFGYPSPENVRVDPPAAIGPGLTRQVTAIIDFERTIAAVAAAERTTIATRFHVGDALCHDLGKPSRQGRRDRSYQFIKILSVKLENLGHSYSVQTLSELRQIAFAFPKPARAGLDGIPWSVLRAAGTPEILAAIQREVPDGQRITVEFVEAQKRIWNAIDEEKTRQQHLDAYVELNGLYTDRSEAEARKEAAQSGDEHRAAYHDARAAESAIRAAKVRGRGRVRSKLPPTPSAAQKALERIVQARLSVDDAERQFKDTTEPGDTCELVQALDMLARTADRWADKLKSTQHTSDLASKALE